VKVLQLFRGYENQVSTAFHNESKFLVYIPVRDDINFAFEDIVCENVDWAQLDQVRYMSRALVQKSRMCTLLVDSKQHNDESVARQCGARHRRSQYNFNLNLME
jgi:hypothetical protein